MISTNPEQKTKLLWLAIFVLPAICNAQQSALLPYRQGDLWGFADENRRLIIPAIYDEVRFFRDTVYNCCRLTTPYAAVTRGDSTWLIGPDGKPFFPGFLRDPYTDLHSFGENLRCLNTPSGAYVLDHSLHALRFLPDATILTYHPCVGLDREEQGADMEWGMMHNGVFSPARLCGQNFTQSPVYWNTVDLGKTYLLRSVKKEQYGLIRPDGGEIISLRYHELSNLWQGRAVADNTIIDTSGRVLVQPSFKLLPRISAEGFIRAKDTLTQRFGFIDAKGRVVLAPQFLHAYGFYKGLAYCQKTDSAWVLVNTKGQTVLSIFSDTSRVKRRFTRVGHCLEGVRTDQGVVWSDQYLFARQADQNWHVFDWNLKELTTIPLDKPPLHVNWHGLEGYFSTKDGLAVFFDLNWELLLEPVYEYVEDANAHWWDRFDYNAPAHLFIGGKGEQKILLNPDFKPIGDAMDERAHCRFGNEGFVFRKNGNYGLADTMGRIVIDPVYDYLEHCENEDSYVRRFGAFFARKDGRCGILKTDGTVGLPLVFGATGLPYVFNKYSIHSSGYSACDPIEIKWYIDSLNGKWHFFNALGVYRAFPDSILHIGYLAGQPNVVAFTAHNRYRIDRFNGEFKPLSFSDLPAQLAHFYETIARLSDSLSNLAKAGKTYKLKVHPAGSDLIYICSHTPEGYTDQGAIFDADGNLLLSNLQQIHCNNGTLTYIQDSFYRQWNVPLMGCYALRPNDPTDVHNKYFMETFVCGSGVNKTYAQGIFKADGTCMLPARCGQRIEYDLWTQMYTVWRDGKTVLYDARQGVFKTEASQYLPYWDPKRSSGWVPKGYLWIDVDHKPGLVRIRDGAAFFEDK